MTRAPSSETDIRLALKALTQTAHEHTERRVEALLPFSKPDAYRSFLSLLLSMHRLGKDAAALIGDERLQARESEAIGLIASDLGPESSADLGIPLPSRETGFAWGILYVCRGSALGGAVLAKRARELSDRNPGRLGVGYFNHCARQGAAEWRIFCRDLERKRPDLASAGAGAAFAFDSFARLLETRIDLRTAGSGSAVSLTVGQ